MGKPSLPFNRGSKPIQLELEYPECRSISEESIAGKGDLDGVKDMDVVFGRAEGIYLLSRTQMDKAILFV